MKKNNFEKYKEYWDEWHEEWKNKLNPIKKDWNIPILPKNAGQTQPVVDYFPEPYYGNPDDEIEKLAVILFYNPGPQKQEQHINSRGEGTFYNNYLQNELNYNRMSANLNFCDNTIDDFYNSNYAFKGFLDQIYFLNKETDSKLKYYNFKSKLLNLKGGKLSRKTNKKSKKNSKSKKTKFNRNKK